MKTSNLIFESTGTEPVTSTPEELAKFQAAESQQCGRIIAAAGIEAESSRRQNVYRAFTPAKKLRPGAGS